MISIPQDASTRDLRQFAGIWFPAFIALLGGLIYWKSTLDWLAYAVWGAGGVVSVAGIIQPEWIRPVFFGLLYVTFPIGWVVSHMIMIVVFYGVITPVGLIMRLLGRDPLERTFDRSAPTYWKTHQQPKVVQRYFRQY